MALFIALILFLFGTVPALALESPVFSVEINSTLDAGTSFNGQNTLVLDWRITAERGGLTLRNTQGLRLAYDSAVLQLMKWDGSGVIPDSDMGTSFGVVSGAGRVGVYNTALRVSAAKSASGSQRYLNVSLGSNSATYTCPQGTLVTLAQVRFAFRTGKTAADLTRDSIRCMSVNELAATAQSSAILINTTENEIRSYTYLRQENGAALGGDALNAPTINYPRSNPTEPNTPTNPIEPTTPNTPTNPNTPTEPTNPNTLVNSTDQNNQAKTIESDVSPSSAKPDPTSDYESLYTDVFSNDWFYNAARYVTETGLMNGAGGSFSPDIPMTRAMFATILYRLAGLPDVSGDSVFNDVRDEQWYTAAIQWAGENGIILGYGDGRFGTNDNITREQAVTLLYRYSEAMGLDVSAQADLSKYSDASQISAWALNTMKWAVGAGIVSGRTAATLAPKGQISRAEAAEVLMNYR
jgi:hypothetical protein